MLNLARMNERNFDLSILLQICLILMHVYAILPTFLSE